MASTPKLKIWGTRDELKNGRGRVWLSLSDSACTKTLHVLKSLQQAFGASCPPSFF